MANPKEHISEGEALEAFGLYAGKELTEKELGDFRAALQLVRETRAKLQRPGIIPRSRLIEVWENIAENPLVQAREEQQPHVQTLHHLLTKLEETSSPVQRIGYAKLITNLADDLYREFEWDPREGVPLHVAQHARIYRHLSTIIQDCLTILADEHASEADRKHAEQILERINTSATSAEQKEQHGGYEHIARDPWTGTKGRL